VGIAARGAPETERKARQGETADRRGDVVEGIAERRSASCLRGQGFDGYAILRGTKE
jgi:hypothetical protein